MASSPLVSAAGASLLDRRGFLGHAATAAGGMALAQLLSADGLSGAEPDGTGPISPVIDPSRPYAARSPHYPARAKRLLVIFCAGAVSQLETWDWKPELVKYDDKPLPGGPAVTFQGPAGNLARPQYDFKPRGHQPHEHPRPRGKLPLHRLRSRRLPEPRCLDNLRPRQRVRRSPFLRRHPRPAGDPAGQW
jgi:hypothetical protein